MKNSFCFGGCLNIQCRSVTGCWASSLAVAPQLSKVRVENSSSYPWSNKIIKNLTRNFSSLFSIKGFRLIDPFTLQHFTFFFSPGFDQGCCNENLWVQRETPLCMCMFVCTHTRYFEKWIDRHPYEIRLNFWPYFLPTRLNQDIFATKAKDLNI